MTFLIRVRKPSCPIPTRFKLSLIWSKAIITYRCDLYDHDTGFALAFDAFAKSRMEFTPYFSYKAT